jgi:hypothetical protein
VRHWWCGLRGHETSLRMAHDALWTRCGRCGYVSPGIQIDVRWVTISWRYAQYRIRFRKAS